MKYIRIGNFEIYPDQLNWSVPGDFEDYIGMPQEYYNLLEKSKFEELIESKIGKGWRLPYANEMNYIGNISPLSITKSIKLYIPTFYNYIVQETMDSSASVMRIFFDLESNISNRQPWVPGFFFSKNKRNFKIQPVRDV